MNDRDMLMPENFAVDEAAEFREKINDLMDKGEKHFVLNFNKCTFVDSTGLGVLVSIYKKCEKINGSLKLHSINPQVMKVFKLTRLDKVFQIEN